MKGLRTICYKVSDLEQAKVWYAHAFEQKPYFDEPFYVGFNIGGYELGLQPKEASEPPPGQNILAYWGVENIKDQYTRLLDLGAKEHEEPTNVGGEIMVASVFDPWDNIIGLIYNPSFKISE